MDPNQSSGTAGRSCARAVKTTDGLDHDFGFLMSCFDAWWKTRQPAAKHHSETHRRRQRGLLRLKLPRAQLAIYACLLVVFAFSLVKAKQMFLANSLNPPTADAALLSRPLAVAVLPFKGLSRDDTDSLLAQDLTAKVADALRKSKSLCVIDPTLIAHFQDGTDRPEHVAQLLHSDQMVTGTAGRSGENIRVAAELLDPRSGKTVWTRQFAREAADWPAMEDEVAKAIADSVEAAARHTPSRTQPVPRLGTAN